MDHQSANVHGAPSIWPLQRGQEAMGLHSVISYFPGSINRCPGCAGTQWFVGRETAQCAFCETALPLAQMAHRPSRPLFTNRIVVARLD